jgi:hypothetical protein
VRSTRPANPSVARSANATAAWDRRPRRSRTTSARAAAHRSAIPTTIRPATTPSQRLPRNTPGAMPKTPLLRNVVDDGRCRQSRDANRPRHARNSVTRQNFFFSTVHGCADPPVYVRRGRGKARIAGENPSYAGISPQIPPITVFPPVSGACRRGDEHPGLLTSEPGGGVRFRQVAWVRSSLLAGVVTSQDKTDDGDETEEHPWPFPS